MRTKGKIELSNKLPYIVAVTSPYGRGKVTVSRGQETGGQDWPHLDQDEYEANAEHLVKCWNAFEDGGLVGELVEVCKSAQVFTVGELADKLEAVLEKAGKL